MSEGNMNLTLKVWRQSDKNDPGKMVDYQLAGVSPDMSFLEMMDMLNEKLVDDGHDPVSFDHDCREGICGMCSMMINGMAHGPEGRTTTYQLHMRKFKDGDTIVIEPWRADALQVLKDLMVDRSAFDEIIKAGGYVTVNTGNAPDANSVPISKENADLAVDAAAPVLVVLPVSPPVKMHRRCFSSLQKISQLALLPQGEVEHEERVENMVRKMDELGFGNCTNEKECEASCPKGISISNIARMNRGILSAAAGSSGKTR